MTTRSDGERKRLEHAIARSRAVLDALEVAIRVGSDLTAQDAEGVAHAGADLAAVISRLWAYTNAERDRREGKQ